MNIFRITNNIRRFSLISCSKGKPPILISKSVYTIKEVLFARKLKRTLEDNSLIAFFHYPHVTPTRMAEFRKALQDEDIHLQIFPNITAREYIKTTEYRQLAPLFESYTMTIYTNKCPPQRFYQLIKGMDNFVLLGAIYERMLLGNEHFKQLSKNPLDKTLNNMRSMLIQNQYLLSMSLSQIANNLNNSKIDS